jgi:hypothetical protein
VTRFGVDYSYDPPTTDELTKASVTFACRYLTGTGKALTLAEAERLLAAGIDIVANYESTKGFMLSGGFNNGVAVAKEALAAAKACGMAAGRPIYFSADSDPSGWTSAQWSSFDAFLDGAASVLGKSCVGVYGGTLALQAARAGGSCSWFWQALGWRNGVWLSWVHIQQYDNGNVLGSGLVDYDRALTGDFGQWVTGDWFDMATEADLTNIVRLEVLRAFQWFMARKSNKVYPSSVDAEGLLTLKDVSEQIAALKPSAAPDLSQVDDVTLVAELGKRLAA